MRTSTVSTTTNQRTNPVTVVVLYAILIGAIIFAIFPIYFVVQAAFRPGNQLYSTTLQLFPANPTIDNFTYIFTQTPFPTWLLNSIKVGILTTIFTLVITISAGYALSRFRFRGRSSVLTMMLTLQAFPALLGIFAIYLILNALGLINTHLGLVLAYSIGGITFNTWNLKGYFDTIPIDLEEAAMIDGCTPTQAFWRVMLPLARPVIAVTALFGFLSGWGEFVLASLILYDENLYTAALGIIGLQDGYRTPWGWFAAASLVFSIPVVILFLFLQRNLVSGLSQGAVK